MRPRRTLAAVLFVAFAAIAAGIAWFSQHDRGDTGGLRDAAVDDNPGGSPRELAAAGGHVPTRGAVRRITVRVLGAAANPTASFLVGIASPDGARILQDRGVFKPTDGATYVCESPRLPSPGPRGVAIVLTRPSLPAVLVPVSIPTNADGGWADAYDVTVTADVSTLTTVVGRVRTSSGPGVPDLRVVLLGPRPPRAPQRLPAAPASRGGLPPPPPPAFLEADPKTDDWASDRPLLGFSETDAEGAFSVVATVPGGATVDARIVATIARTATALESRLSAPVLLRAGELTTVNLEVEEGAVVDGKILVSEHEPMWGSVQSLTLAANAPSQHFSTQWLDGMVDPGRISGSPVEDDDTFRLTGIPAGPCLLVLAPPHGPRVPTHPDVEAAGRLLVSAPATAVTLGTPSRSITFRVEDAEGGVGQAIVKIEGRVGALSIETGGDGYADAIVPTSEPLRLTIEATGHTVLTSTLDAATSSDPVRLRLAPDASVEPVARETLFEDGRRPIVQARLSKAGENAFFVNVKCRVKDASGRVVQARFGKPQAGIAGAGSAASFWHDVIPGAATLLEPSAPGRYTIEVTDERFVAEPAEMTVRTERPTEFSDGIVLLYCRLR